MPQPDFDPLADDFVRDPHPTYTRLREQRPLARGARWNFWALTKYQDVRRASSLYELFTSAHGVVVPSNPVSGRRAPLHFDPPEHPRYRRPLNAVLSDTHVEALEPRFRELARELLEPLVGRGSAEFVSEFSSPFASLVFAEFVSIPRELALEWNEHSDRFERAQAELDSETAERENQILYASCRELVASRRAEQLDPRRDLLSALLAVRVDGKPLEDEFVAGSVRQLLVAAHVAPKTALASAAHHLARDRELQERLRSEPERTAVAVEELLRLYTPNQGFARTATEDAEIRGRRIEAGEKVALVLTSANRDEEVFADPHAFRLDRDPNPHIAFGHGPHKCPGAATARAELRIALEELLARTTSFELAGEIDYVPWPLYGPATLPLRFS